MSATAQRGDGDVVPNLEPDRILAEFYNLACEFVTENDARLNAERRLFRHVQIAAADAASADADQHFGAGRARIADVLDNERPMQFVKDRCLHGAPLVAHGCRSERKEQVADPFGTLGFK
jgi:hypothetical protein